MKTVVKPAFVVLSHKNNSVNIIKVFLSFENALRLLDRLRSGHTDTEFHVITTLLENE